MESVSLNQVGIFVGCFVVALGIAVGLKMLFGRTPPLHKEYVLRTEHDALEAKMNERLGKIADSGRESREKMHKEIEALKIGVGVVQTQNAQQNASLKEIRTDQQLIKSEIKSDNTAMNTRIGEILTALGEIKGRIASN